MMKITTIDLIGNATYLFRAEVDIDLASGNFLVCSKEAFTEQAIYEKLQAEAQAYLRGVGL